MLKSDKQLQQYQANIIAQDTKQKILTSLRLHFFVADYIKLLSFIKSGFLFSLNDKSIGGQTSFKPRR